MILSASAFIIDDTDDDGVDGAAPVFTFTDDGTTSTVTGITDKNYAGPLTIPDTLGGKPVTAIGDRAFDGCTGLTSLTIPEGVTSIGVCAFYGCTGLTGALTIPNGVTSIGISAFYGCTGLTGALTIPNGVTSIGEGAFRSCTSLTGINVDPANQNYSDVDGVLFNKNKTELKCCPAGKADCTIPSSVTSIEDGAFAGCSKLTSLTIPGSVTSIGEGTFRSCTSLTGINVDPANQNYSDVDGVLFNKNKTELKCCPAGKADCTIPVGVTSIGYLAFDGCSKLTSLTIPGSVTSIGARAFNGCIGLTSLTIPSSVTSIGEGAFYDCTGLTACTVTGSPTAGGILETYFKADGSSTGYSGWKLPGMSTAFSTLTIDSDKALDLTNVAGSAGKSVKFTAKSVKTVGGIFDDPSVTGADRAGKTFEWRDNGFKTVCTVTVTVTGGGTVEYQIGNGTKQAYTVPFTALSCDNVTLTAAAGSGYRFGGWTVNGEPIVFTLPLDFKPSQDCKITVSFAKVVTDDSAGTTALEFQGGLKVELSTADLGSNYIGLRETSVPGYQKAFELTAPGLDGKTLRITIPFDPIRGHTPSVCFLDPNGPVPMRIIEVTATSITFETDHNSTYVLRYVPIPNNNHTPDEPAVNPPSTVVPGRNEPVEEDNGALYVIAAAAAAIAVLLVATYNLYGRK